MYAWKSTAGLSFLIPFAFKIWSNIGVHSLRRGVLSLKTLRMEEIWVVVNSLNDKNTLFYWSNTKKLCSLSVDFLSHLSLTWRLTIFESLLKLARSVKANLKMNKMTFIFPLKIKNKLKYFLMNYYIKKACELSPWVVTVTKRRSFCYVGQNHKRFLFIYHKKYIKRIIVT